MTEIAWLVELDSLLTFAKTVCGTGIKTVAFTDPCAMRFKREGDADFERQQLEARFPWMKGRLAVREHMWL